MTHMGVLLVTMTIVLKKKNKTKKQPTSCLIDALLVLVLGEFLFFPVFVLFCFHTESLA